MIFDGKNPDFAEIVKRQAYKDRGGSISCGHDFWEQARKMDFGDVVLCHRCNQYFAKIKHLPWVTIKKKWLSNEVIGHGTNHLPVTKLELYELLSQEKTIEFKTVKDLGFVHA